MTATYTTASAIQVSIVEYVGMRSPVLRATVQEAMEKHSDLSARTIQRAIKSLVDAGEIIQEGKMLIMGSSSSSPRLSPDEGATPEDERAIMDADMSGYAPIDEPGITVEMPPSSAIVDGLRVTDEAWAAAVTYGAGDMEARDSLLDRASRIATADGVPAITLDHVNTTLREEEEEIAHHEAHQQIEDTRERLGITPEQYNDALTAAWDEPNKVRAFIYDLRNGGVSAADAEALATLVYPVTPLSQNTLTDWEQYRAQEANGGIPAEIEETPVISREEETGQENVRDHAMEILHRFYDDVQPLLAADDPLTDEEYVINTLVDEGADEEFAATLAAETLVANRERVARDRAAWEAGEEDRMLDAAMEQADALFASYTGHKDRTTFIEGEVANRAFAVGIPHTKIERYVAAYILDNPTPEVEAAHAIPAPPAGLDPDTILGMVVVKEETIKAKKAQSGKSESKRVGPTNKEQIIAAIRDAGAAGMHIDVIAKLEIGLPTTRRRWAYVMWQEGILVRDDTGKVYTLASATEKRGK